MLGRSPPTSATASSRKLSALTAVHLKCLSLESAATFRTKSAGSSSTGVFIVQTEHRPARPLGSSGLQLVAGDGLRCTFTGETGERCSARVFLQIHHEHAWAKGGPDTLGNLRLLCAAHNRLLAELEFGERRAG